MFTRRPGFAVAQDEQLRTVLVIRNDDQLCMARALVVGQAFADKEPVKPKPDYRYVMLMERKKLQTSAAKDLIQRAGLPERKYSLADMPAFEQVRQNRGAFRLFWFLLCISWVRVGTSGMLWPYSISQSAGNQYKQFVLVLMS